MKDLKRVYKADTLDMAELALDELADTWRSKYPIVIDSWRNNWEKLTTYFQYSAPIRKLIYTTNAVEGDRKSTRLKLQSRGHLVCRLLLEKKKIIEIDNINDR